MARKLTQRVFTSEPHVVEEVKPRISLYCPLLKGGTRDILYCVYKCKKNTLIKCDEYEKAYPSLLSFEIDPTYQEKYGMPTILVPLALRKRRKRRNPNDEVARDAVAEIE